MTADDSAPSFPERVGRYELLLPIGTGGMATVYLARVAVVGDVHREVALKLMHPFMQAEGRETTVSMVEEAKLAVRIRHPNVVPVVEVGDGPQGVFLVMEYVEGDTLSGLHRAVRAGGGMLPLPIAGRILVDALAGLHAAHELRNDDGELLELVHRDFSPQNILVGADGVSRLTDFGVAKAAGRVNVTSSGIIKGKVAYMAPEQALGKKVDRRCDVWAAGVVLWEVLAGQRLYREQDQVATLLKIVNEPPPRVGSVRPDLPKQLDQLVADALTMDVEARIPSAAELRKRVVEAWKAVGGLADPHEVGEFVQATASTKIGARREQVSRVIKLRSSLAKLGAAAARAAADTGTPSVGTARAAAEETTSAISASSLRASQVEPAAEPPRARTAARALLALGGLAAAVAIGVVSWQLGKRQPSPSEPPAMAATAPASAATPQAEPAPAPAPAAATATPLSIEANAAIKSLKVNGKSIPIDTPARGVKLVLGSAERGDGLELEALAEDQRKASAKIAKDASTATLSFAEPRKAAPAAPRGKVVRDSNKPAELPGLAPTPY